MIKTGTLLTYKWR